MWFFPLFLCFPALSKMSTENTINVKFRKHDVLLYLFSRNLAQKKSKWVIERTWVAMWGFCYGGSGSLCPYSCFLPVLYNCFLPHSYSVRRTAGYFRGGLSWPQLLGWPQACDLDLDHQSIPSPKEQLGQPVLQDPPSWSQNMCLGDQKADVSCSVGLRAVNSLQQPLEEIVPKRRTQRRGMKRNSVLTTSSTVFFRPWDALRL